MFNNARFFIFGVVVTIALMAVSYVAFAQDSQGELSGSYVIDIQQSIPIDASLVLPPNSGEVTVTFPLTVDIDLQVTIAGPQVLTATSATTNTMPNVTVREVQVDAADEIHNLARDPDAAPIVYDLEWDVGQMLNTGNSVVLGWEYPHDFYSEDGEFRYIEFDLKNVGNAPVEVSNLFSEYHDFVGIELRDDQGRTFSIFESGVAFSDEECKYDYTVNPGLTSRCFIAFEVPNDSENLTLKLTSYENDPEGTVFYSVGLE